MNPFSVKSYDFLFFSRIKMKDMRKKERKKLTERISNLESVILGPIGVDLWIC